MSSQIQVRHSSDHVLKKVVLGLFFVGLFYVSGSPVKAHLWRHLS